MNWPGSEFRQVAVDTKEIIKVVQFFLWLVEDYPFGTGG